MSPSLRQQSLPSMAFLIAGILFAVAHALASQPPPPIIGVMIRSRYLELNWLGVGWLVCLLYATLYYVRWKFLRLRVSLPLSLLHLLITLLAVFGLGQVHYIGFRTEQTPISYNPALAFLGVHALTLLLLGGLLFPAIIIMSWLLKRPAVSH